MTSLSPTRRVLSALNANTAIPRPSTAQYKPSSNTPSPTKPQTMAETFLQASLPQAHMPSTNDEAAGLLGAKRKSDRNDLEPGSAKRVKSVSGPAIDFSLYAAMSPVEDRVRALSPARVQSAGHRVVGVVDEGDSESACSQASDAENQDCSGLDDSQSTTLTIPDDVLLPRPSLTREEMRQRARQIKLRLKLASYKVRTNQIHLPMSELELRSSPSTAKIPSLPRTTLNSSHTHPSHPPTASNRPRINVQKAAAHLITSSPPSYRSTQEGDGRNRLVSPVKATGVMRDGFATPLLPRQRQGLLNPPMLGSPSWDDRGDLTSSVVKGRAADGLLSLMRQSV